MSQSPIQAAIQQICQEKNLPEESVLNAIESAMAAAYRKDFGNKLQNIITEFDAKTGDVKVFDVKTVVENQPELDEDGNPIIVEEPETLTTTEKQEKKQKKVKKEEAGGSFAAAFAAALKAKQDEEAGITAEPEENKKPVPVQKSFLAEEVENLEDEKKFNPKTEIEIKDALLENPEAKLGDEIITPLEVPGEFGRMAAQTAKQVIIQKLREEERQKIYEEYKNLEHTIIIGTIQRREGKNVLVDVGNTVAILPPEEQVDRERYNIGNRMKFYLKSVDSGIRGSMLLLSRTVVDLVRGVFEDEIPEIAAGSIEIKSIAREAGNRTKVAIASHEENIDPIGSCVGQRGSRIQTIIGELNGEKVDIILWDENPGKFITNSLSPAKVTEVTIDEVNHLAKVTVKEDQLSLAIGRGGQNVRLASRLTGWKIDIISTDGKTADEAIKENDELTETPSTTEEATDETATEPKEKKSKKKVKEEATETSEETPEANEGVTEIVEPIEAPSEEVSE